MLGKDNYENIKFKNNYPFNVTANGLSSTFPSHWHHYAELIIVLDDILKFQVNEDQYILNSNDLLLAHPCELHALIYNQEAASSYIIIQFDASFIFSLPDFKKHQYWMQSFHYLPKQENPDLSRRLIALATEIKELYENDTLYKDAKICSKLLDMFTNIGEYVISDQYILGSSNQITTSSLRETEKSTRQSELTEKMIDVCSYISQNCTQDMTLAAAANYAGFSIYHFSRLFSQFTGNSFVEFLTSERLKKAVELLLYDNLSIMDVAMMSGFTSISTFNRCFQKYRNDSPSNFRKHYNNMKESER